MSGTLPVTPGHGLVRVRVLTAFLIRGVEAPDGVHLFLSQGDALALAAMNRVALDPEPAPDLNPEPEPAPPADPEASA